jgi:prolyl oligopeptidase
MDTYFGTTIVDPYRWLEDLRAPDVRDWFTAQNSYARSVLDALPSRAALRDRLAGLASTDERVRNVQWGGDLLFYEKRRPNEDRFSLYVRTGVDGAERLLVDPARFDADHQPAAINFYAPSPNGKRVAFGISLGGNEDATLRVIDVATRREIGEPVPRMDIGDPASWRIDGTALFYTQLNAQKPGDDPVEKFRNGHVYMRDFTGPDRIVFGQGVDTAIALDPDDTVRVRSYLSSFAIAVVQHGNENELTLYAAPLAKVGLPRTPWRRIAKVDDGVTAFDVRGEWIYLATNAHAPRYRVVRWALADGEPLALDRAEVVVPESARVITGLSVAKDALYVQQMDGGYGRLLRLEFNVKLPKASRSAKARRAPAPAALPKTAGIARATELALPFEGTIEERVTDPMRAGALVRLASWTRAPAYYAVQPSNGALVKTSLQAPSRVDFSGVAATRIMVKSHDGVDVPVSIVYRRDVERNGEAPLLLDAYGAYGISQEPYYSPSLLAWLERGGVFAVAHVRGGGEFGKAWHDAGRLADKPNTWLDLIAAADALVRERWTSPAHLGIIGGSAGGIAVGGAMVTRPELFRAVVSQVGVHDLLRSELTSNGPSNIPEFGTVTTEAGFRMLYAMSSYHHVKDGVAYPAALFTTGFNDPRVDSWEPAKMAARLQAVNGAKDGSGRPVLLRVDFAGGHGIGSTKQQAIEESADVFAFLLWQLGGGN